MTLLCIFTDDKQDNQLLKNLDLNYMSTDKYGKHIEQTRGEPIEEVDLKKDDLEIHVLAHGNKHEIAKEDAEKFAERLLKTFRKDQLNNRDVFVYACNFAEGGAGSLLDKTTQELKKKNVKNTRLIGSVAQTFTKSTGTMMVLKDGKDPDKLSKDVEGKGGHARDQAAAPYLREFREGWRGYKIRGDGEIATLNSSEAGSHIPNHG